MRQELRYFNTWRRLGLLIVAVDVYLALAPSAGGSALVPDKVAHFLSCFAIAFWFSSLFPRMIGWVFAGTLALGGGLEILQGIGGVRVADWMDMAANTAGAVTGCAIVYLAPVNVFQWFEQRLLPDPR